LLAGAHLHEHNDTDDDGWADVAGYERGVFRPRLFWDGGDGRTAFFTAGATYENRDGGTMAGAVLPVTGLPYQEALETRRFDIGGSGQFVVRNRHVISIRAAAASQWHRHQFGDVLERDRHTTFFGEVAARTAVGRHTWVAGLAIERNTYDPADVPRFAYAFTVPGIFLQDDIAVRPWITLSASARLDYHSEYGLFFSPRLSAFLRSGDWSSRFSVSQGFFGPTPLTEETEAAGLARLQIVGPLEAERGRSVSADLTRNIGPLSTTFTLFASRVRKPLHVERSDRYELSSLQNSATNTGLELLATIRHEPFSLTASYTYVRARERLNDGQAIDVALTPRHSVGLVGMWEIENQVRIGLETYYTGSQRLEVNPFRETSRPYFIVGALAERRFGPARVFFNAENLTNVRQTRWDPLIRPAQSADGRWTVDAWAPLDGRVFNGGVRLDF
jgi:iron complex outermembrane receptor protein